jgi:hypothetical protein
VRDINLGWGAHDTVTRRRRPWRLRTFLALVVSGVVLVPSASSAVPLQENDPAEPDVSGQSSGGRIELDIEVDRADESDIENAFGQIRENVETELAALTAAEQSVKSADGAVLAAEQNVASLQTEIDGLVAQSDDVVVRTFVNPPSESAIESLTADSVSDATIKHALLDMRASADAAVLDKLHGLEADLEEEREAQDEARALAADRRAAAELALADLEDAASQQVTFAREIERRLERNLGEIEALKELDPELAAQLQAEIDKLSGELVTARDRIAQEDRLRELDIDAPTVEGPATIDIDALEGSILSVSCPSGGEIEVHKDIADSVRDLLNLSHQKGLSLCGNGYRSIARQIELRRKNCGGNVWTASPSACSPPTARPGQSMHERGLAIDFTCGSYGAVGRSDPCFSFLAANAGDFGLKNLPSEPWHWSSDGT